MLASAPMTCFAAQPRLLALLLLLSLAAAPARAGEYEAKLAAQFAAVAFDAEIGGHHRAGRLIRWVQPIRAQMMSGDIWREDVARVLSEIRRLTRHDMALMDPDDPRPSNFHIWVVPHGMYRTLVPRYIKDPCFAEVESDPRTGEITRAAVKITGGDRNLRAHCLVEELSQAMGLMNDARVFDNSIFNDSSQITMLSYHDRVMLAVLYADALRPNMARAPGMQAARALIHDLHARTLARRAVSATTSGAVR